MTLRARLAIAAGIAVALAVIAVTLTAYAGTKSELRGQLDHSLENLLDRIVPPGGVRRGVAPSGPPSAGPGFQGSVPGLRGRQPPPGFGGPPPGPEPIGVGDEGLSLDRRRPGFGGTEGIVTVIHPGGSTYIPPGQGRQIPVDALMRAFAARGRGTLFTEQHLGGMHIRVLVRGLGPAGAIAAALPMTDVDRTLSDELLLLLAIAGVGIALAALLGVLVARTALGPIGRFTSQAEAIAANPERLEQERLHVEGDDELARLGRTFNTTLDALERSVQSQRNLVADASHELRTPIASVRANLQLLRDEALLSSADRTALREDMIEELDELTALVADVVELARGSKPGAGRSDVRLDEVVTDAIARTRRRYPQLAISPELEPALVQGEGDRIARAVLNLLDNAARWSPEGGTIAVTLRGGTLIVRDHGPGFHAEDLPFVFDRFHRARDARAKPGSGLGLAIVRQAAEAHGGFVEATIAEGGGAQLRIGFGPTLPLQPQPQETISAS
ncbi:MAG: HAMP domain-containing histidine kinase [Actinomycetota bacterium]|nr:HAMP domain-containing histidine kinase [Actinomycetota bacterium]